MSLSERLLTIPLVALFTAACSAAGAGLTSQPSGSPVPSPSPTTTGIVYPTGATDLVLRLRDAGGLIADPHALSAEFPVISVYGDGTVIVLGPQIEIYPGPALPNLQRATIGPAGMQILLESARDAGLLGPDAHYDLAGVPMDAGSAEFTVNADGRIHTVSAYALIDGADVPTGSDPAVTAARAKLASFQTRLGNLDVLLGGELGSWASYEADAVQLLVSRGAPDDGQGLVQQPLAWPLSTSLADLGASLPDLTLDERCGVISGSDLNQLMPLLKEANTLTAWTDGGASFGIGVRQMLPGEELVAICPLTSR